MSDVKSCNSREFFPFLLEFRNSAAQRMCQQAGKICDGQEPELLLRSHMRRLSAVGAATEVARAARNGPTLSAGPEWLARSRRHKCRLAAEQMLADDYHQQIQRSENSCPAAPSCKRSADHHHVEDTCKPPSHVASGNSPH